MTAQDYDAFVTEYRRLSSALERYKQTQGEVTAKADAYFHVLKKFPLSDVILKADRWLEVETKFPKPAEWAGVIVATRGPELRTLSEDEARAYHKAELQRWEGPVCDCADCRAAGVTAAQPIRFVPIFDSQDREVKAFDPLKQRVIVTGRWIHGAELQRWYAAKAQFFELYATHGPKAMGR